MSEHCRFPDLRELLAKANEEKSGDQLAGIGAASERERVAAKSALADLALIDLKHNHRIREGLELARMTDGQALAWLQLL